MDGNITSKKYHKTHLSWLVCTAGLYVQLACMYSWLVCTAGLYVQLACMYSWLVCTAGLYELKSTNKCVNGKMLSCIKPCPYTSEAVGVACLL